MDLLQQVQKLGCNNTVRSGGASRCFYQVITEAPCFLKFLPHPSMLHMLTANRSGQQKGGQNRPVRISLRNLLHPLGTPNLGHWHRSDNCRPCNPGKIQTGAINHQEPPCPARPRAICFILISTRTSATLLTIFPLWPRWCFVMVRQVSASPATENRNLSATMGIFIGLLDHGRKLCLIQAVCAEATQLPFDCAKQVVEIVS